MRCKKVYKYFLQARDGTLDVERRRLLENHLAQCAGCAQEWESANFIDASLKRATTLSVPDHVWEGIAAATVHASPLATRPPNGVFRRITIGILETLDELSWGSKMAFSSAVTAALAVLVVWGSFSDRQPHLLPVIELSKNPVGAFPSYFREHHHPAGQPIADRELILAFNTLGDNR